MSWTDDELMAYADGELTGVGLAAFDEALRHDVQLRGRVSALQAQRQRLSAAFAGVLEEPVPERLTALLAAPGAEVTSPQVVDLAAERERRHARRGASNWAQWGGMAASVALGVALGMQMKLFSTPRSSDALVSEVGGRMVAGGRLAQALNSQLAANPAAASSASVAVQLSFVDKRGQYCRTFSTDGIAGLACREAADWAIQTTTTTTTTTAAAGPPSGEMRQASSALPRVVLEAVDARMAGTALTAPQEQEARDRGWAHR